MDDKKKEDYTLNGGLANLNLEGVTDENLKKIQDAYDEQLSALQHRYDKPNWWKVAAGFAKPQLGGFLASAGSAMEALGENTEQQRSQQLPIAQMKIQREMYNTVLGQNQQQRSLFDAWKAKNASDGTPMDENTLQRIVSLNPSSPIAKAVSDYWTNKQQQLNATGTAAELKNKYPELEKSYSNLIDQMADPTASDEVKKARRAEYEKNVFNSRPPSIDQATWNGMDTNQKKDAVYGYSKNLSEVGLSEQQKSLNRAKDSTDRLVSLGTMRDYALGKGLPEFKMPDGKGGFVTLNGRDQMNKALGVFQGGNLVDILGKAISEGKGPEFFKGLDQMVAQGTLPKAARVRVEELAKELAKNSAIMRNATVNPTDAYGNLVSAGSPSLGNSQQALVGILDNIAHAEHKNVNENRYMTNHGIDFRNNQKNGNSDDYLKFQQNYNEAHKRHAIENPSYDTPYYYNPNYSTDYSEFLKGNKSRPTESKQQGTHSLPPGYHRNEKGHIVKD